MTVKQLLEKLKHVDKDAIVLVPAHDADWELVENVHVMVVNKRTRIPACDGEYVEIGSIDNWTRVGRKQYSAFALTNY